MTWAGVGGMVGGGQTGRDVMMPQALPPIPGGCGALARGPWRMTGGTLAGRLGMTWTGADGRVMAGGGRGGKDDF